eukprot:822405-Prymnesium_polylepis.1
MRAAQQLLPPQQTAGDGCCRSAPAIPDSLVAAAAAAVGDAHVGSAVPRSLPPPAAPSRRLNDA